ncbi:hypothetical protein [Lysinibacillus fusiformis]|uniref:hypothetical protein n=1 Tax=Lysinibacillus fusiformis TaxID=28031 RepID=UPI0021BE257B|nr:hypothetical protein [Lysinibacillus fusiformis]UXJ70749.1 hypothetical protein N5069_09475 [Lysinibacillus fusiformis]WEA41101.1 hypothetical protein PWJ66_09220 [Lysinibacillus fusiformis]
MRFIKWLVVFIIFIGIVGYGVLYFGTKFASEKIVNTLSTELENSGQMEEIKNTIENDPELKAYMEEAKTVDSSTLPFTSKEDATKVIIQKVGITELNDIRVKLQDGSMTKEEALQQVEGKLSDEEIAALKVIIYKELYE